MLASCKQSKKVVLLSGWGPVRMMFTARTVFKSHAVTTRVLYIKWPLLIYWLGLIRHTWSGRTRVWDCAEFLPWRVQVAHRSVASVFVKHDRTHERRSWCTNEKLILVYNVIYTKFKHIYEFSYIFLPIEPHKSDTLVLPWVNQQSRLL